MAAGIPILAFDTYYYQDLAATGAVAVVPWLDVEQLGEKLAQFNNGRHLLAAMMPKAVAFAQDNTQEIWLDKRFKWTLSAIESTLKPAHHD